MSVEQNKQAVAAAVAAWNAGDGEGYLALYDPSIQHHGLGPEPLDEAANRAFYEGMWASFPGAQLTIDDTVAEGDKLALRFHVSGQHDGEFMDVAPTGPLLRPQRSHGDALPRRTGGGAFDHGRPAGPPHPARRRPRARRLIPPYDSLA